MGGMCGGNPEDQKPSMEPAEFDPTFHGPIHNRYCTDIICCAVFLVAIFFHVVLGLVAWQNGHPEYILYTKNSTGQFCGLGENADKPYLYYYNFMACAGVLPDPMAIGGYQCPTTQVCVKECPREMWVINPHTYLSNAGSDNKYKEVINETQSYLCIPGLDIETEILKGKGERPVSKKRHILQYMRDEKCPFFKIMTTPIMGRCVPDPSSISELAKMFTELKSQLSIGTDPDDEDDADLKTEFHLGNSSEAVDQVAKGKNNMKHGLEAKSIGSRIFEDFGGSWSWIVLGLFTSMLVSLGFLLLLRYTAAIMVWSVIGGTLLAVALAAYFSHSQYVYLRDGGGPDLWGDIPKPPPSLEDLDIDVDVDNVVQDSMMKSAVLVLLKKPNTWLTFCILLALVDCALFVMVIFLRERLRIALAIIQEASKAIGYMVFTLAYPVVTFVLVLLCVGFWGTVSLYLVTLGDPTYQVVVPEKLVLPTDLEKAQKEAMEKKCAEFKETPTECNPNELAELRDQCVVASCALMDSKAGFVRDNINWVHAYNLFAALWAVNFIIALGQCTLAGAYASYYWAFCKPGDIPRYPLMASFTRTMRFHAGSLAFGSLIITLLQLLRMIVEYVDHKTKDAQNPALKFIARCLKCLFWLLEKFLKFLNRNAYIMLAIYGKNFCVSAKNAFFLLLRNVVRVVVLDRVTDMLIFFGKLMVVGSVGTLFYLIFSGTLAAIGLPFDANRLNFYWMPVITVALGAYVVASGFFSVYAMCVDTLFLCFLEDLERNDGTPQKPYYMSSNLMNILGKTNQPLKKTTTT